MGFGQGREGSVPGLRAGFEGGERMSNGSHLKRAIWHEDSGRVYWCQAHGRVTLKEGCGRLHKGGIMIPCRVVELTGVALVVPEGHSQC